MAKKYTIKQFYQEFLSMQGWCIFDTKQDKHDDSFEFLAQYVGKDNKYDNTTSYDITMYRGAGGHIIVIPEKR